MNPDRTPAARFVILNAARTGSNYLCTVLNSHPEILCHHEIFNPHVIGVARHLQKSGFRLGTMEEREKDPVEFLERVWRTDLGHPFVGFKLCWRQHEAAYHAVLPDRSVRKILLRRKNRVKTFVSLLLARQTGEWVVYDDAEVPAPRPKIRVEAAELLENIAFNQQYYSEIESVLRQSGQVSFTVYYEDLFSSGGLARVLQGIGVSRPDPALIAGHTRKLTASSLREIVTNFDELSLSLRGTDLEVELHSTEF